MSFHFPSISLLAKGAIGAVKRFPLPLLSAVVASGIGLYMIELKWEDQKNFTYLYKVIMCCWLGMNLFLALSLFSERKGHSLVLKCALQAMALGLAVGYYFTLPEFKNMTITDASRYALFNIGLHLFVSFAPFIGRGEVNGFWQFNKNLFLRFLLSALYSAVLYLGLALAILAVDQLFNVHVKGERYAELWICMAGIFNTWFFLSGIPVELDELETQTDYPKGLKVFTQFVLLPLVAIYLLILYAYGTKILIQWQLPKGWVSYLVNAFSVFGILSLLLIFPIRNDDENKWMKIFSNWFYRALFPLIILLGAAIGKRVFEYGITENRYFVLIVALWLTGVASYFLLSKRNNIKVIPVSLCLIAFLSSFGPWGAFGVSERSQVTRLEKLLIKENILVDGKIKKASDALSVESRQQITSIVHYLGEHHTYDAIKPWFTQDLDSVLKPEEPGENVYAQGKILGLMGVEEDYSRAYGDEDGTGDRNFNFYVKNEDHNVVSISGFDYSCTVNRADYDNTGSDEDQIYTGKDSLCFIYRKDKKEYAVVRNGKEALCLRADLFVKSAIAYNKEHKTSEYDNEIPADKMILEGSNVSMAVKIYVTSISGTISESDTLITSINGTMLVKFGSDIK